MKKFDVPLLLKMTAEMKAELEALAVKEDRSVNWLIRHAIEKLLREKEDA